MGIVQGFLRTWKSGAVVILGTLASGLVAAFAPLEVQIGFMGALVSCVAGILVETQTRQRELERRQDHYLQAIGIPASVAHRTSIYRKWHGVQSAFSNLLRSENPILEQIAELKLASIHQDVESLAMGRVEFTRTESWRLVYDQMLLQHRLKVYRSAAWIRDESYWQDSPGQQSIQTNYQALALGLRINRIFIVAPHLMVPGIDRPVESIWLWMREQATYGITVRWLPEVELAGEVLPLVSDFGIYGSIATGEHEMDERCRTLRFTLSFDPRDIELARQQWERIELFSKDLF
jgi:hypothetical protein